MSGNGGTPALANPEEKRPPEAGNSGTKTSSDSLGRLRLRMKVEKKMEGNGDGPLDHRETPLRQEDKLVRLGIRSKMLVLALFDAKIITPENAGSCTNFDHFATLLTRIDFTKIILGDNERRALLDLTALKDEKSSLHRFWQDTWPDVFASAMSLKEAPSTIDPKKEKGWTDKVADFYGEHKTACIVAGLGLLAGGLYLFFKKKKQTTEEGVQKSTSLSWGITAGVIAGLGAAVYFGWDHIKSILKKAGVDVDKAKEYQEKIEEANKTRKERGVAAAAAELFNSDLKPEPWHIAFSNDIKTRYDGYEINPDVMRFFGGKMKYQEFRDSHSTDRIAQFGRVIGGAIKDFKLTETTTEFYLAQGAANLNRLFETFEESGDINAEEYKDKPLGDVLMLIKEKMRLGQIKAKKIDRDVSDMAAESAHHVAQNYKDFATGFLSDAEFVTNGSIKRKIEFWKNKFDKEGFDVSDTWSMPADIMKACYENGIPMAIGATGIFAWNGLKWVFWSRSVPLARAASELVDNGWMPGDWKVGEALKVYGIATTPMIVLGMARGVLFGTGAVGKLQQALSGGVKGALAPVKIIELAKDAIYYSRNGLAYSHSVQRRVLTFVEHQVGGRSVRLIKWPAGKAFVEGVRSRFIVDRIIALEEKQNLLEIKIHKKWGMTAKWEWERESEAIGKKIKQLHIEYGRINDLDVTGADLKDDLKNAVQSAKVESLGRMYEGRLSTEAFQLIKGNTKLTEIFLREGYGNAIVRRALKLKDPNAFLKLLSGNEECLKRLIDNPGIATSRGFVRIISISERLPANIPSLLEAMTQDSELAKLLTDPRILSNKQFLIDLEAGIRSGGLIEGIHLDIASIKIQATAAQQETLYVRFKEIVSKSTARFKGTSWGGKVAARASKTVEAATSPFKKAYQEAAEILKSEFTAVKEGTQAGAQALKTLTASSSAMRELNGLKAKAGGVPNPSQMQRIQELEKTVAQESAEASKVISSNKKLAQAWKEYQELMAKVGGKVTAFNEAQFLRYRNLWMNAAALGGVAFIVMLVHGLEKADNKVDFLIKTPLELAAFYGGFRLGAATGAALGARMPGPFVAKAACVVLGVVAGYFGSEAAGGIYQAMSTGVLDRYFVNRGRDKRYERLADIAEVYMGGGLNNVRALLDSMDVGIMNISEGDIFPDQKDADPSQPQPNLFYYQDFLAATQVEIGVFSSDPKRNHFRTVGVFDREIEQLAQREESDVADLAKERDQLLAQENPAKNADKLDELERSIDLKNAQITALREQVKIGNNPVWAIQQELYHSQMKGELDDFKAAFINCFTAQTGEQKEISDLLDHLEERLSSGQGDLLVNSREEQFWKELRDKKVTVTIQSKEKIMDFKDWFALLRHYTKSYRTFEEIRHHGKIRDDQGPAPLPSEVPKSKDAAPPQPSAPLLSLKFTGNSSIPSRESIEVPKKAA